MTLTEPQAAPAQQVETKHSPREADAKSLLHPRAAYVDQKSPENDDKIGEK